MKVKIIKNIITANLPGVSVGDVPEVDEIYGAHLVSIGVAQYLEKPVVKTDEPPSRRQKNKVKKSA